MGRYAQLIIGPAGSGKSTYCSQLNEHFISLNRRLNIVNFDPAADYFDYPLSLNVKDLVNLDDVMNELNLGPNGGLMYCMEFLEDNIEDWLADELEGFGEDDYLVFDCPGEIELFTHVSVFKTLVDFLQRNGWRVCTIYILDSQFITDVSKFISGTMQALSAMTMLEVPHVNVLTKMDICPNKENLDKFLIPDGRILADELSDSMGVRYRELNEAVVALLDDYSLVSFIPLDITSSESIASVLIQIDLAIQYGEEDEVKSRDFEMKESTLTTDSVNKFFI
jgi:hypothetical protein